MLAKRDRQGRRRLGRVPRPAASRRNTSKLLHLGLTHAQPADGQDRLLATAHPSEREGFEVNVLAGSEGSGLVFTEEERCRLDDLGLAEAGAGPHLTPSFAAAVSDDSGVLSLARLVLATLAEIHSVSPKDDLLVDLHAQPMDEVEEDE